MPEKSRSEWARFPGQDHRQRASGQPCGRGPRPRRPGPRRRDLQARERQTDGRHLNPLSGLEGAPFFYVLLQGRRGDLRYDLQQPALDPNVEASGLVNLQATAAILAQAAQRPLFTLLVPQAFK